MATKQQPAWLDSFEKQYPAVWEAFESLGKACHESGGPLEEKTRRLVKIALAIGTRHEGAVHSAVRQALASGVSKDEIYHVAILAITTCGWPAAYAAMTWIADDGKQGV
jgi:alkylhydroperoxidase/carboxymuconolactone decarboxylase family protein YurZ